MELNNKLIQLSDMYCKTCNNFLNFPIMLIENKGNVCGRCFTKEPTTSNLHFLRNETLENIIRYLEIPCRYKSEGCASKLFYNDISIHEEYCPYRQYNCPALESCFWRGSVANLVKHFESFHPNILLKSDTLTFDFSIDMTVPEYSSNKLLVTNGEAFLLQIKIENDNLWCAVCYIGDEDKGLKYEYIIEEIGYKMSVYFRHDSKKAILSQSFMSELDHDRAIQIDMKPLKVCFDNVDVLTAKLHILGGDLAEELDESLLCLLECPVCNLYMLPPIHQCLTGHNICCKCRPKLGQCPTCRGRIENTRNYGLEAVSAKTKYPCANRLYGCMIVLPGSLIEKHEQECKLRTYGCIIPNATCSWQGKYSDLIDHLKTMHKLSNTYQTKVNYNGNQFYMYTTRFDFLLAHGQIFKIGHKYENNSQTTFWNCKVIGSQNKSKYKFRITYCNDPGDFFMSKGALCLPLNDDEDFFNHNLAFTQTLVTRVGNTVKCEIIKL